MNLELTITIIGTGIGIVLAIGTLVGFLIYRMDRKFDRVDAKFDRVDAKLEDLCKQTTEVKNELHWQGERLARVETKVDNLDERMGRVETKIEKLDERVARLETKIDNVDGRVGRLEVEIRQIDRGVARLEGQYSKHGIFSEPEFMKLRGEDRISLS